MGFLIARAGIVARSGSPLRISRRPVCLGSVVLSSLNPRLDWFRQIRPSVDNPLQSGVCDLPLVAQLVVWLVGRGYIRRIVAVIRLHYWGCIGRMATASVGVRITLVFQGFRRFLALAVICCDNGRGGIRTHGTLSGTLVFKTSSFGHSDTLPGYTSRQRRAVKQYPQNAPQFQASLSALEMTRLVLTLGRELAKWCD